jgi:phospholipid-binding lipoprotein MlaA
MQRTSDFFLIQRLFFTPPPGSYLTTTILAISLLSSGCASMNGDPRDPLENYNRAVFQFNQDVDRVYTKPIAKAYKKVVPTPINRGITNFFSNLYDVTVLANDILQLKFGQAAQDTMRIFFNSTVGLAGFIDVATYMELPRHNEDFGQTLGYWGVPPGPYFVLPFLGPSSIRDSVGLASDYTFFSPIFTLDASTRNSMVLVNFIDTRAGLLGADRILNAAALDPYVFMRDAYLQRRQNLVYDGNPPENALEDDFADGPDTPPD